MTALPRVGVLVEMRSVEEPEPVLVVGEVGGHPVEQDSYASLVQRVDKEHEVVRRSEAARRREVADRLIAPRPIEGMLSDRQQLDVRVAHLAHVLCQRWRHFPVREPPVPLIRRAAPRTEVQFIHRHGRRQHVCVPPTFDPCVVAPTVAIQFGHPRGRAWSNLGRKTVRIGALRHELVHSRHDPVLVRFAGTDPGNEPFPDARLRAQLERRCSRAPLIEVGNHIDLMGVGCPHREAHPFRAIALADVCAELVEAAIVFSFGQQMEVERAEGRPRLTMPAHDATRRMCAGRPAGSSRT